MNSWLIQRHLNYMAQIKTDYVCIICMVSMSSLSSDNNVVLEHFINHFESSSHDYCEEEQMKLKQSFKTDKKKNHEET